MTYLAIISAALTAIFIGYMGYCIGHWDGYIKGYNQGKYEEQATTSQKLSIVTVNEEQLN